jgi:hypothetical protein
MLAISALHKPTQKETPSQALQHWDIGIQIKPTPISDLSGMAIAVTSAD